MNLSKNHNWKSIISSTGKQFYQRGDLKIGKCLVDSFEKLENGQFSDLFNLSVVEDDDMPNAAEWVENLIHLKVS